jgi:hypothetical protein
MQKYHKKKQGHYQALHGNLFGIFKRLLGKIRGANINKQCSDSKKVERKRKPV